MTTTDRLLPLRRADEIFGADGPGYDRLLVWIRHGFPVNGRRVRLGAVREGRRWMISEEIVARFRSECAAASLAPEDPPAGKRRPGGRERRRLTAAAVADQAALRRDGWMN